MPPGDWTWLYIVRAMFLYFGLFALCYAAFRGDRPDTNRRAIIATTMATIAAGLFVFDLYVNVMSA